ncbi:MAG: phosphoglycolate phosphatase [Pseudomonadota bacterium]
MGAVLFDLDGTLIDSLRDVTAAANAVLQKCDLPALPTEIVAGFVGMGEQVFVDRLIAATALAMDERDWVMEVFIRHYREEALNTRLMPGARRALEVLKVQGVPMGLVTNKPRAPLVPTLDAVDLAGFFDVVIAGDDLAKRKPDPLPLRHAMAEMGVDQCIYVGDSSIDAETAEAAGVPFVLYTEGIRTVPVHDLTHEVAFNDFGMLPAICARLLN